MIQTDYFIEAIKKFFIKTPNYKFYPYDIFKDEDSQSLDKFKNELNISISFENKYINKKYKTISFYKDNIEEISFGYFNPPVKVNCIDSSYEIYTFRQGEILLEKNPFHKFTTGKNGEIIDTENLCDYCGKAIYLSIINEKKKSKQKFNFSKDEKTITINDLTADFSNQLYKNNEFFMTKERRDLLIELNSFLCVPEDNFRYYYGKHGIGKTFTFLYLRYYSKHPIFYFNCKQLFFEGGNNNSIGNYIQNEILYAFKNEEKANAFISTFLNINNLKEDFEKDKTNFNINLIKKIINSLKNYNKYKDKIIVLIFDQFKEKYDKQLNSISLEIQNLSEKGYFKYIQCSSINEEEVRTSIESDLFGEILLESRRKYKYLSKLVTIDDSILNGFQNLIFQEFGRLPLFHEDILKLDESSIDVFLYEKKKIYKNKLKKFLTKKIIFENLFLSALISIFDIIGKEIDKQKLKLIFKYIPVKLVIINKKNDKYILEYIFPFIKSVYYESIKEKKLNCYYDYLLDSNGNEEGYILERLVYFSFDKGERPFIDKDPIEESYLIDQVKYLSKIFLDLDILLKISTLNYNSKNEEIFLKLTGDDEDTKILRDLIQDGKLYNFRQNNSNGQSYDGGILIPLSKNRNYEFILYQITKCKSKKNRVNRDILLADKYEIINLFQKIFDITISKFSFMYILLEEEKDTILINFCKKPYNNLSYIFFSLFQRKLLPSNKKKSDILYLKDICNREIYKITPISDLVFNRYKPDNFLNSNEILDVLLSNNFILNENNNLLTKKRASTLPEKDIKITNYENFCLLKSHCGYPIIPKNIQEKDIKKYLNDKKKKKHDYIEKVKKNCKQNNRIIIPIEEKYELEQMSEQELKSFENMKFSKDEENNILQCAGKSNIKVKIIKRMYIDFPKGIPKFPLFITIYDKNLNQKYMFYDEDIIDEKNNKIKAKIMYNITKNKPIDLELYFKIENDSFEYNFKMKYSTYLCGFLLDENNII